MSVVPRGMTTTAIARLLLFMAVGSKENIQSNIHVLAVVVATFAVSYVATIIRRATK